MTPLHLAVQSRNIEMVKALLPSVNLETTDINNNSIYHYAANTTQEMIYLLKNRSPTTINHGNVDGYTAIHWACLSNNPDCSIPDYVQSSSSGTKLSQQDMKNGGTPLHWVNTRDALEDLLERNCDINALDFSGRTALHVMVSKNKLECVVSLVAKQAELDIRDEYGNTPLHNAVEKKFLSIVQSLLVFGCDINIKNKGGHTARHLVGGEGVGIESENILYILNSVGAERCSEFTQDCKTGCAFSGTYNGIHPKKPDAVKQDLQQVIANLAPAQKSPSISDKLFGDKVACRGGRLLCLDGGGIKGLVLTQMLLEIESLLKIPIRDVFDWIAGTSTGGILALALGAGKSLRECICIYMTMKEKSFVGTRPYSSDALEGVLKDVFGENTVMSDIKSPKLIVTSLMADQKPSDLHMFRNYKSSCELLNITTTSTNRVNPPALSEDQLVWHAARATGAAPSYFRAFGRFLDGGLIANNPTLDAMTEIHEHNLALQSIGREDEVVPLSCVVSLGTGLIPTTILKEIDVFRPDNLWDTARLLDGITAIGNLLVDQATLADGRVVDRAKAWCSMIGVPYYRFNPQLSLDLAMDETTDSILVNMMWETKAYIFLNRNRVLDMIKVINN
ncbi:unnamed protein product [Diamesa hyperborea]